jgi:hypothetical protein
LISAVLRLLFDFLSLKIDGNVPLNSNLKKNFFKKISFLLASWRSVMKIAGSGSISQRHGSADPDPHQNVMDPQHWCLEHPAAVVGLPCCCGERIQPAVGLAWLAGGGQLPGPCPGGGLGRPTAIRLPDH